MKSDFLLQGPLSVHCGSPFAVAHHMFLMHRFSRPQFKSEVCLENEPNISSEVRCIIKWRMLGASCQLGVLGHVPDRGIRELKYFNWYDKLVGSKRTAGQNLLTVGHMFTWPIQLEGVTGQTIGLTLNYYYFFFT